MNFLDSQKNIWNRLLRISISGNIANAYIISGPIGSGKEAISIKFAQLINCETSKSEICGYCGSCIRFKNLQHENLNIIVPLPSPQKKSPNSYESNNLIPNEYNEEIKKKSSNPFYKIVIPKSNRILISSIRGLRKSLYFKKDSKNGRNIVIIFDAEMLCSGQGESGNALLKLLEEPPDNTTFILVTDHELMLSQTIVSRCQQMRTKVLNDEFIINYLLDKKIDEEQASLITFISQGNLHLAQALLTVQIKTIIDLINKLCELIINMNSQHWGKFVEDYSRLSRNNIQEFKFHFSLISLWFRNAYFEKKGLNNNFYLNLLNEQITIFNKNHPNANYQAIILCIEDVLRSPIQNFHMPLILINFLLDVQKYIHGK